MAWHMFDFDLGTFGQNPQGGGLAFNAGNTKFIWDCPVPSSSSIEFEAFPDEGIGNATLGCSLDARKDPQTWPSVTVSSNDSPFVFETLPTDAQGSNPYGSPLIRTPSGGTHNLVCDSYPDNQGGDGGIFSYRTQQDWSPSSNKTGGGTTTQGGIDLNPNSRWSTGANQSGNNGWYYEIDMRTAKSFSAVEMDSGGSTNDYPRGYAVYVSNDGSNWGTAIATGSPTKSPVIATFTTRTARFIKVVQSGTAKFWWSIAEFTVFK